MSSLSLPAFAALVVSSGVLGTILAKVFDRSSAYIEVLRKGYADATDVLNRWSQFPLRIGRRVNDSPETRARLEALGAEINERLAYSAGWVSAESSAVSDVYNQLVTIVRGEVSTHARESWVSPPADSAIRMNLGGDPHDPRSQTWVDYGGLIPAEWLIVQLFSKTFRYRFGWRRYVLPGVLPTAALRQDGDC